MDTADMFSNQKKRNQISVKCQSTELYFEVANLMTLPFRAECFSTIQFDCFADMTSERVTNGGVTPIASREPERFPRSKELRLKSLTCLSTPKMNPFAKRDRPLSHNFW